MHTCSILTPLYLSFTEIPIPTDKKAMPEGKYPPEHRFFACKMNAIYLILSISL